MCCVLLIQVRRTKISERIRKLQELVPNMDKVPPSATCTNPVSLPNSRQPIEQCMARKFAMRGPPQELTHPQPCTSVFLQQTNTSDMLDLAVDYIKDLQQQVKVRILLPNRPANSPANEQLVGSLLVRRGRQLAPTSEVEIKGCPVTEVEGRPLLVLSEFHGPVKTTKVLTVTRCKCEGVEREPRQLHLLRRQEPAVLWLIQPRTPPCTLCNKTWRPREAKVHFGT